MFFTASFTVLVPWITLISAIVLFLYYWIAKVYFKYNNFIIFKTYEYFNIIYEFFEK